jgi:sterol-4alpha-carboxylate 3-dehydrogenase (decarboxylating)
MTRSTTSYGMSKVITDAAVQAANDDELRTAVLRLPGRFGEKDTNVILQLVLSVRKKENKTLVGGNNEVSGFVYAGNAAGVHFLAARALTGLETATGVACETFSISDGRPEPFSDVTRRYYAAGK